MKKTLAKIVKSVVWGYFKLAYRWTWIIGSVMILQRGYGATFTHSTTIANSYSPGSLKRPDGTCKYTYGTIDWGFYLTSPYWKYWFNTLKDSYAGDESAVRESHVPSAMVDVDGILYTIDLAENKTTRGPGFIIAKFTASDDGRSVSKDSANYYPWAKIGSPNVGSTPNLPKDIDKIYFENFFHNCLQPCIAQEIRPEKSDYMSIFFRIPPGKYCNDSSLSEGILYQDFKKSDFSLSAKKLYNTDTESQYWFKQCRYRRFNNLNAYEMEKGNYKAWKYGNMVHLDFIGSTYDAGNRSDKIWHQYNSSWQTKSGCACYKDDNEWRNSNLCSRYIYDEGYVYSLLDHGYAQTLYRWSKDSVNPTKKLESLTECEYTETTSWGHSEASYDIDFFI